MPTDNNFKTMFTMAALWNWMAALLFMAMAVLDLPILSLFLIIKPASHLWFNLFFGVVFVFGLGYFWAAKDLGANRNIVKMGAIGKIWVFFLILAGWLTGSVTFLAAVAGTVDLVFAALFVHALNHSKTARGYVSA
ncbi:MAG: hypothetical protein QNI88_08250 [Desulfobacterales bacterium]|nr:hypothetical protein [Desulfobacterales bacterium]